MPLKVLLFLIVYFSCAIGSLYRPILGICGYIFTYSLYSRHVWWGSILASYPIRYSLVMALCIFIGMLINKDKISWQFGHGFLEIAIYLFSFFLLLSLFIGISSGNDSYDLLEKMIKVYMFIFMFTRIVNNLKYYDMVIYTLVITGILLGLIAYQAPPSLFLAGRLDLLGGPDFKGANEFAIHLAMILCFIFALILRIKLPYKIGYIAGAALILNAIILTRARAVFISFLAVSIYSLLCAPKMWRKQVVIYLIFALFVFFQLADPGFFYRMQTIKKAEEETSAASRLWIWKASLKMLKDYPLGVGLGNFKRMIGLYDERIIGKDAHNTFVRCYGELGIQGLFWLLLIIFLVFKHLKYISRIIKETPLEDRVRLDIFSISLALIAYLVGGLTHTRLYIESLWWLFAMPICLEKSVMTELKRINQRS